MSRDLGEIRLARLSVSLPVRCGVFNYNLDMEILEAYDPVPCFFILFYYNNS